MNATQDRELLELAAKAAGLTTQHKYNAVRLSLNPPIDDLVVFDGGGLFRTGWNPLTNDDDALQLAVRLKIDISHCASCCACFYAADAAGVYQDYGADPYAATRRAIVMAAVALVQGALE